MSYDVIDFLVLIKTKKYENYLNKQTLLFFEYEVFAILSNLGWLTFWSAHQPLFFKYFKSWFFISSNIFSSLLKFITPIHFFYLDRWWGTSNSWAITRNQIRSHHWKNQPRKQGILIELSHLLVIFFSKLNWNWIASIQYFLVLWTLNLSNNLFKCVN